jgi:probable blue pigment (indigoidine) exporter
LPVGVFGLADFHPASIPLSAWIGALYLGLVSSVVMYLLWFRALSLREASRVSIVANGQPILTALLAWAVFGTPPSAAFGVGAALVIAGVVIAQT